MRLNTIETLSSALYWLLFSIAVVALAVLMQHSIDFTDQGSYLQHYVNPELIKFAAFSFYFYVAPLFDLLNFNLYHLRLAGLGFLLLACVPLGILLCRHILSPLSARLFWPVYLMGIICFYRTFVVVPGYKWFLMIAMLLFMAGIARIIYMQNRNHPMIGGALVGLSGWMAFLAKPPSGALFALIFVAVLAATMRPLRANSKHIVASISSAGAVVLAGLIFHISCIESLSEAIARLQGGLEIVSMMQAGHAGVVQLVQSLSGLWQIPLLLIACGSLCSVSMLVIRLSPPLKRLSQSWPWMTVCALMGAICVVIAVLLKSPMLLPEAIGLKEFVFVLCIYAGVLMSIYTTDEGIKLRQPRALLMAAVVFLSSIAFRAGSAADYLHIMNFLSVCYVLMALLVSASLLPALRFRQCACFVILPLFAVLYTKAWESYNFPYANDVPVHQQHYKTQLTSNPNNVLYLDKLSHEYIETLRSALHQHEFSAGQLLLDMTGNTPLITYLSEARITPATWIIGYAKGANTATLHMLKTLPPAELQKAWLLMPDPDAPQTEDLDPQILAQLGLSFPAHYEPVARMRRPYPSDHFHTLYKPIASEGKQP